MIRSEQMPDPIGGWYVRAHCYAATIGLCPLTAMIAPTKRPFKTMFRCVEPLPLLLVVDLHAVRRLTLRVGRFSLRGKRLPVRGDRPLVSDDDLASGFEDDVDRPIVYLGCRHERWCPNGGRAG